LKKTSIMLKFSFVESRRYGDVVVLSINDPPANTLTYDLVQQLEEEFFALSLDPGVRAVLITGAGDRFFSGGVNIGMLRNVSPHYNSNFILYAAEVFERIDQSPLLIVAAINGHITGGGLELALVADRRVAVNGTYNIGFPEVRLGVIPGLGGTQRLSRIIGARCALELITHGEFVTVERAQQLGIVDSVLPRDGFVEHAVVYVRGLLSERSPAKRDDGAHHPWQPPGPDVVTFRRQGRSAVITLTEACCSLSPLQALWALDQAILQARLDDGVETILVTHAGDRLCIGSDSQPDDVVHDYAQYVFQRLENFPRLCVLAFSGALDLLGTELALACDYRFTPTSILSTPSADKALMTVSATSKRIERYGLQDETRHDGVLRITRRYAIESGLVREAASKSWPDGVLGWLGRFVSPRGASKSIGYAKFAIVQGATMSSEGGMLLERHLQEQLFRSHDGPEGMKAYLEKRSPVFRGD